MACYCLNEVFENVSAFRGVGDFWMELDTKDVLTFVSDRLDRAVFRASENFEPRGRLDHLVVVRFPGSERGLQSCEDSVLVPD